MLPEHYRLQVENQTGATLTTAKAFVNRKRGTPNGMSYRSGDETDILNASSVTDGTFANGTAQNNGSAGEGWYGFDGEFEVNIATGTPAGIAHLFLQVSPDGTDWPDNGEGFWVASLYFSATGTKTTQVSY